MKKLDFKPYVQVYLDKKKHSVKINRPFKDQNKFYSYKLNDLGLFIFENIDGIKSQRQIRELALEKFEKSQVEIDNIFNLLFKENYIEEVEEYIEEKYIKINEEFERIIPIWSQYETKQFSAYNIQEAIMEKHVGVIGCGTIGFGVVSDLVASGIRKFTLIDKDIVELSNLSRQPLFELDDIGKRKVEVVKKFVERRRTNSKVIIDKCLVETEDDLDILKDVDIILVSADYPSYWELAELVQNFAFKNNIAVSFAGGYKANHGRIYPLFIPNKSYCFKCLVDYLNNKSQDIGERLYNRRIIVSSNSQMSKFISSVVSSEIIKYLSGVIAPEITNKYASVNFLNYEIDKHPFHISSNCSYCNSLVEGKNE